MIDPGPGYRRVNCPSCGTGVIRMSDGSARLQCSNLRWSHSGFSGGSCDYTTRDYASVPLRKGEALRVLDFTPFAYEAPTA